VICSSCKQLGLDHDFVVQKCKQSLHATAFFLCGFDRVNSYFHQALFKWSELQEKRGKKFQLIMVPRFHLKTSAFSKAEPIHHLINDREERILLVHESSIRAAEILKSIKAIVLSERFRHFFPELVPDPSKVIWNQTDMEVVRKGIYDEGSVSARGVDSTITGGHFNRHIFDDLVGEKSHRSPAKIQRAIDYHLLADPLFIDAVSGTRKVVGTYWPGGFYEDLEAGGVYGGKHGATVILGERVDERYRAFLESIGEDHSHLKDGAPVWPEIQTDEGLREMESRMGPYNYSHQMRNIKISESAQLFTENKVQYALWGPDHTVLLENDHTKLTIPYHEFEIYGMLDPATGENRRTDSSAIVITGVHRKSAQVVVFSIWEKQALPNEVERKIFELVSKWRIRKFGVEQAALQAVYKRNIQTRMQERKQFFVIDGVPTGNISKVDRAVEGIQPLFANGQMWFFRNQSQLIQQLLSMRRRPGARSPNLVDALALQAKFWGLTPRIQEGFVEDGDIPYEERPLRPESVAYGLRCAT